MRPLRLLAASAALGGLVALGAPAPSAQEGVALFRTLRVGMKIRYQWTQRTALETKGDWTKGTEKTKGKEKQLEVEEKTWLETVLGVKEAEGHLLERFYENSTKGTAKATTMPKKVEPERTGIHGKTLFLRCLYPSVHIGVRQGSLQGEQEGDLKFIERLYTLVPEGAIKTGQSWEPDGAKVGRALFDGIYDSTNFQVKAKCTYKGNDKVAGRSCAKIQLVLAVDVAAFGEIPEVHIEYTGQLLVALDNGIILGYDLSGPIRYRAKGTEGGAQIVAVSEGVRSQSLRGEILEDGTDLQGGTLEPPPEPK